MELAKFAPRFYLNAKSKDGTWGLTLYVRFLNNTTMNIKRNGEESPTSMTLANCDRNVVMGYWREATLEEILALRAFYGLSTLDDYVPNPAAVPYVPATPMLDAW